VSEKFLQITSLDVLCYRLGLDLDKLLFHLFNHNLEITNLVSVIGLEHLHVVACLLLDLFFVHLRVEDDFKELIELEVCGRDHAVPISAWHARVRLVSIVLRGHHAVMVSHRLGRLSDCSLSRRRQ